MAREKRKRESMLEDFTNLSFAVKSLDTILRNSDMKLSEDDVQEWNDQVNEVINNLNSLKEDVIRYFYD